MAKGEALIHREVLTPIAPRTIILYGARSTPERRGRPMNHWQTNVETGWQAPPLCCRYLVVHFGALTVQESVDGVVRHETVRWALGVLASGENELVGTWVDPALATAEWPEVFVDLQARGVRKIRLIVTNEREAARAGASTAYSAAAVLPSTEQLLRQSLAQVAPRHRRFVSEALGAIRDAGTAQAAQVAVADLAASPWGATNPDVVDRWRCATEVLAPIYALGPRLRRVVRSGDEVSQRVAQALQRAVARQGCFRSATTAISIISKALARADRAMRATSPLAVGGVRRATLPRTKRPLRPAGIEASTPGAGP